jgi:hypothetical protein
MKYSLFFILITSMIAFGCSKDPVEPVIIVNPGGLIITLDAGNLVEFNVQCFAGDNALQRVEILQKPLGGVTTSVLDSLIGGEQADFFWVYELPLGEDDVALTFNLYDTDGRRGQTLRRVVSIGNSLLEESTGHHLYSLYSTTSPNAFNLAQNEPLFLTNDPDTLLIDLIELDETDDGTLSYSFTSQSGIKFAKNNSFNYSEATQNAAGSSFESSTPLQVMSDLAVDDIIITEYDTINHVFAVMKITEILDLAGSDDDRYTFNVKK